MIFLVVLLWDENDKSTMLLCDINESMQLLGDKKCEYDVVSIFYSNK